MVQSIEEIENKLKMEYILHKSSIADDDISYEDDESFQNYDDYLKTHLSILSFGRTYKAVKENIKGNSESESSQNNS